MTTAVVGILLITYTLTGLATKRLTGRVRLLFVASALVVSLVWYATW